MIMGICLLTLILPGVSHIVHTCGEQSIDLSRQAVSNAITTGWLMLMHNLKSEARVSALADYKELTDEATSIRLAGYARQ
jgi:hypothetical protein